VHIFLTSSAALNDRIFTETVHVGPTYLEAMLQQTAIEKKNDTGKWRIFRDVLMISIAFMVHFTAFVGTIQLQS
jgi:hypothetical protein